mgnify:CR=1 FL=1
MWIYMNDCFLSIIENDEQNLTVCALRKEDITRVFPEVDVIETSEKDYGYSAIVTRRDVAMTIAKKIMRIDYHNFKDSVKENDRKYIYSNIWSNSLQLRR